MAGTAEVHHCCLEWTIIFPFQLARSLETTFYHGSPTLTRWRVTFQTFDRLSISNVEFSVCLETLNRQEIVADRMLLRIHLDGECISLRDIKNYPFKTSTWYRYYTTENFAVRPETKALHMVITIELSLPGRKAENLGNFHFSNKHCLTLLRNDLTQLYDDRKYSNMYLVSSDKNEAIGAHSYILYARWNNFFEQHPIKVGTLNTVKVDITHGLLKDILNYMYTGKFSENRSSFENPAYASELFQVINHYELYHLYKVFVKSDSEQIQVTRNPMLIEVIILPLGSFIDCPMKSSSRTFFIDKKPEYFIAFRTQASHDAGNPISYTLRSESLRRVYVQVNMELLSRAGGNDFHRIDSFHEETYTIDPKDFVQSKGTILLGQFSRFESPVSVSAGGAGTEYFIRFVLNIANTTAVSQVLCVDDTLQSDEERLTVLSDHMYKLRKRKFDTDMVVLSSSEDLRFGGDEYEERIHKGILAARVPEWSAALENVQKVHGIPNNARFTLDSLTLPFVLDYMYTGGGFSLPFTYIDEVLRFAMSTTFSSLFDFLFGCLPLDVSPEYFET